MRVFGLDGRLISLRGVKDIQVNTLGIEDNGDAYMYGVVSDLRDPASHTVIDYYVKVALDSNAIWKLSSYDECNNTELQALAYGKVLTNDEFGEGWVEASGDEYSYPEVHEGNEHFTDLICHLATRQVEGEEILKAIRLYGIDVPQDWKLIRNYLGGWICSCEEGKGKLACFILPIAVSNLEITKV